MKKLLFVVLIVLLLSGCKNSDIQELGYSANAANVIVRLSEENQAYFASYDELLEKIVTDADFNEDNFDLYLKYKDIASKNDVVKLVNDGTLNDDNYELAMTIASDDNYIKAKLPEYLSNIDNTDEVGMVIRLVNAGKIDSLDLAREFAEDPMFVLDNLDLYLEYYDAEKEIRDIVEYVNTKNYLTYYEDTQAADVDKYGDLVLVNKYHYLTEDYVPEDLVDVEGSYGVGQVKSEVYEAFKTMVADANKEGLSFYITSPYRSYQTQSNLYNGYLKIDPQSEVDIYSARPGFSEHQLGLAIDILKVGTDFGTFGNTKEAKWLADNAYRYGFILRYPEDKVDITGYKYEPWHFRYLGVEVATDVKDKGVTYDEYFEKYIKES